MLSGKPKKSEFTFLMDQESAQKNMCVLKKYNYDLKAALAAQEESPLTVGLNLNKLIFWNQSSACIQIGAG